MKKVTLYDHTSDKMFDIMLSPDDARRAISDITFATSLLNAAILQQNQGNDMQTAANEVPTTVVDNDLSMDGCEEGSLYRWTDSCVIFLLRTYQEMEKKFTDGKISHKKCWEQIAKIMKDKGYNITGPQCSSKLRSLKKTYKSIKDHNAKSSNERRTWNHYEIMEEIFSKKAWCNSVALVSSTGLSVKNTDNEDSTASSSQMSCIDDLNPLNDNLASANKENMSSDTKTPRQSATSLLNKRLAQKEMHEQKRQKRHEQRMEMEQKLIDILAQSLNK